MNMTTANKVRLLGTALFGVLAMSGVATSALAQETSFDKLANLPFAQGRPTKETAQKSDEQLLKVIAEGSGKMPASKLNKDEQKQALGYVRTLAK